VDTSIIYKGQGFTCGTEARWATFFDALGVQWEYGSVGLGLEKAGWYGALFHLPRLRSWIEVRPWPEGLNPGEFWPRHLAWAQRRDCSMLFPEFERLIVLCGAPRVLASESLLGENAPYRGPVGPRMFAYEGFVNERSGYVWSECPCCGAVDVTLGGRTDEVCECCVGLRQPVFNPLSERLIAAYHKAEEVHLMRGAAIPGFGPDDVPIQRWRN